MDWDNMQGLMSLFGAFGLILIVLGFMGWTLFDLPALPIGCIVLVVSFVLGYIFDPTRRFFK